jgi:hypothetical protein
MDFEEIAVYFENPPDDPMGHEHVFGKLRATEDQVILHWKLQDRTFNKADTSLRSVELAYEEVESATLEGRLWFNKSLVFQVRDPSKFAEVPGADMGKLVLQIDGKSKRAAKAFLKRLDYKLAEAAARQMDERLSDLNEGL